MWFERFLWFGVCFVFPQKTLYNDDTEKSCFMHNFCLNTQYCGKATLRLSNEEQELPNITKCEERDLEETTQSNY